MPGFMIDHVKECEWCEHYDRPVPKLEVKHLPSDHPSEVLQISETPRCRG
jgi:hypothetical protein